MRLRHFINDWRLLSAAGRVLVFNSFSFNLGFYMLLPYLAEHLQNLGFDGWYIGLIIGLRVLSQQGLFLVGGTLGDRFGYKRMILWGCAVRIVGFFLLGVGSHVFVIILGAFCTGFAGALFTPSSQAYLSSEYPDASERHRVFALQNLAKEAGMLIGPLIGLALFFASFMWVGLSAASVFSLLFLLQWYYLPRDVLAPNRTDKDSFLRDWWLMLKNKPFLNFVMAAGVYQILFHQLYLAIPHQVKTQTGSPSIITWVFMISSLMGVLMQLPVSYWVDKTLGVAKGMGIGMALMGSAFLVLNMRFEPWLPLPFVLCAILLSGGSMMVYPLIGAYVPNFAEPEKLASYYGLNSCIGGFFAFIGNWCAGWLLDLPGFDAGWLWFTFALLGAVSGFSLFVQVRKWQTLSAKCSYM
ncbi:MDR family MFS transporter [Vibrio sp. V39_P1S14PM300]|uniref:MDR family MFS transporter n=1 Tax=Vibrio sp. V39_P1S14PM300 TaxID=1938690 RepID=UPI0013733FD8|nr:MFS transporter [Vibrio sp. V39_P1S14PM300]NAX23098.1 MFS transporter [Vibrio sp. V39_P1S14PM300]